MRFGKTWARSSDSKDPFHPRGAQDAVKDTGAALVPQHLEAAQGGSSAACVQGFLQPLDPALAVVLASLLQTKQNLSPRGH